MRTIAARSALTDVSRLAAIVFGRGFVSEDYATTREGGAKHADATAPNPGMAGSIMHFRMACIEDVWARIKRDVYWTHGGVWDHEKATVVEFIKGPGDDE